MSSFQQAPNMAQFPGATTPILSPMLFVRFSMALCLLLLMMDGTLPELEIAIFGGRLLIPIVIVPLYLIGCVFFTSLIRVRFTPSPLLVPVLMLLTFLVLDSASLHFIEELGAKEIFDTYFAYFWALTLAAVCSACPIEISEDTFTTLILICFWVNFIIALMQYVTNTPILATASDDQTYVAPATIFSGGLQRAFGLFNNGLNLGLFCSFVAALGARFCRSFYGTVHGILIIAAAAFICYATYTRLTFVCFVCCLCSIFVFSNRMLQRFGVWLPLLWFIVGLGVLVTALSSNVTQASLSSTDSMNSRYAGWMEAYGHFTAADLQGKLFGIGMVPNPERNVSNAPTKIANYPIDSVFFILLIYIGIVGIIFVAYFLLRAWLYMYRTNLQEDSDLRSAITAFWSTILLISLFNWTLGTLSYYLLMFALLKRKPQVPNDIPRPLPLAGQSALAVRFGGRAGSLGSLPQPHIR